MKLLLDTHIFLWWIKGDARLSMTARIALMDLANERFLSSACGIELAVKLSLKKLSLTAPLDMVLKDGMARLIASELPITLRHSLALASLPFHHRDPFDRILVAQAVDEGMTLISADSMMGRYGVPVIF